MAEVIRMPRLSDTMEEGVIVAWHKKVGDKVSVGDILAEVETDKATMDLESFNEGYLLYIGVEKGAVPVDGVLAVIGKQGEDYKSALAGAGGNGKSESQEQPKDGPEKDAQRTQEAEPREEGHTKKETAPQKTDQTKTRGADKKSGEPAEEARTQESGRIKASPLAKSIANQSGIDLGAIKGTGEQGRIIKRDVEGASARKTPANQKPVTRITAEGGHDDFPVSQMRKTIARRLSESKFSAPHFYLTMEIDMSQAVNDRKKINALLDESTKVSFNDLVIKACAAALIRHPKINASWMEQNIRQHHDINIGVAVAVEDGLLVPVIRNANAKGLTEIHSEVVELAERAKVKRLQPEEMQGNTFTVSNLGMFGIEEFTAIINPPDSCILAVGAIIEKPVVKNSTITTAHMMKVTLSCDHRVVDGASGAQFLKTVKQYLESPVSMLA